MYLYHCKVVTGMMVSADEGRGVPVPLQDHDEGGTDGRQDSLAPGLRVIVQ